MLVDLRRVAGVRASAAPETFTSSALDANTSTLAAPSTFTSARSVVSAFVCTVPAPETSIATWAAVPSAVTSPAPLLSNPEVAAVHAVQHEWLAPDMWTRVTFGVATWTWIGCRVWTSPSRPIASSWSATWVVTCGRTSGSAVTSTARALPSAMSTSNAPLTWTWSKSDTVRAWPPADAAALPAAGAGVEAGAGAADPDAAGAGAADPGALAGARGAGAVGGGGGEESRVDLQPPARTATTRSA